MQTPFKTSRFAGAMAVLLLACLGLTAGAPSARADHDAGKRALEAGQPDKAAAQWRAAAQAGDRRSMLALGRLLAEGSGVVQDYVEAHKWFNLAASRGEAEAAKERDAVATKMTPAQVASAQERAKAWQPRRAPAGGAASSDQRPAPRTSASSAARPKVSAPAAPPDPAAIEASLDLQPADRRLIQSGLVALGFRPGPADGVFGPTTRAALKAWQRKNGKKATGWLTEASATALKAAGAKAAREKAAREKAAKVARAALKPGRVFRDCKDCPEMVVVPAGSFTMGSPPDEEGRNDNEGPQHRVTIAKPFAVGKYEVTRGEFARFVEATGHATRGSCSTYEGGVRKDRSDRNWRNPGFAQSERDPVACVNWHDARAYVSWLSNKAGKPYRLPSESEWEYAARAGTTTARYWAASASAQCSYANGADSSFKDRNRDWEWEIAPCRDGIAHTAPVGSFAANRFGFHDLLGNVWEWTEDCWHETYEGAPSDDRAWTADSDCSKRVLRSGSWFNGPDILRVAFRTMFSTGNRNDGVGFRVARALSP